MAKRLEAGTATLGVMGGGQLGRMFVHAAQALGYRTVVLDPDPESPAGLVAHEHLQADYLDEAALTRLAAVSDAISTEFENVPADALRRLAQQRFVAPAGDCVAICQDRADEKAHFQRSGVACAPYAVIRSEADLAAVPASLLPGILKTARMGYDGKGQVPEQIHAYLSTNWKELRNLTKDDPTLVAKARDRWYVPDPNKAGDLEKLREKALLKEFEEYKEAKKKLKVFPRLEVLRAGFRAAWAAKDYQTIISIANKLPEETLQEDEKLLTLYDLALTRTEDGI